MAKTGKGLVEFAKSKVGTPYFYGCKLETLTETLMQRMHTYYPSTVTLAYMLKARLKGQIGKINADCSSIIGGYRGKQLGSSQLYQTAYTRLPVTSYRDWADGVECWRSGHVGTFFQQDGRYYVVEAKGINYGTVISEFDPKKWECGLTFKDIEYTYDTNLSPISDWHKKNPYTEPVRTLKKGDSGVDVMWVQFELCEAGYETEIMRSGGIDGVAGRVFDKCVRDFQRECGITVDGIVGKDTRKRLKAN